MVLTSQAVVEVCAREIIQPCTQSFRPVHGEVRDRTYEDQLNAASALNLLLAAIACWNTVHLQACIKRLRADGEEIDDDDLRYLSPLLRHHIGIYGQYNFDFRRHENVPAPDALSY